MAHRSPSSQNQPPLLALLWLALMLVCHGVSARQNVTFQHLSIEQGLSQESVNVVVQDATGFIWIGTQEGLNRFDGQHNQVFLNDPDDPATIPSDWINDLLVLNNGDLWIATNRGLAVSSSGKPTFQRPLVDGKAWFTGSVMSLLQTPDGKVWIGTENQGLWFFDPAESNPAPVPATLPASSLDTTVRAMTSGLDGQVIVAVDGGTGNPAVAPGIYAGGRAGEPFKWLDRQPAAAGAPQALHVDNSGDLWAGYPNSGLAVISRAGSTDLLFQTMDNDAFSLSSNRVTHISQDANGRVWVGTDQGLHLWAPDDNRFYRYLADPKRIDALSDNRVTHIFSDRGGVLWIATYSGVSRWNALLSVAQHEQSLPSENGTLNSNIVTSITTTPNNTLVVGTFGGGLNYRLAGSSSFETISTQSKPMAIADNRIMTLATDSNGRVLAGTRNQGLVRLNLVSGQVETFNSDPNNNTSISANAVTAILPGDGQEAWVATFGGGVNRLLANGEFQRFSSSNSDLVSDRIVVMAEEPATGRIWFGSHNSGISIFQPGSNTWETLSAEEGLPSNAVVTLGFSDGFAWIGTRDAGLVRLSLADRENQVLTLRTFDRRNGLSSNAVMGMQIDTRGRVWLSTNRGINVVSADLTELRHFSNVHGLQGWDFNSGAAYQSAQGHMYFGGNNGLNHFDPDELFNAVNRYAPPVVLTGLTVTGGDRPLPHRDQARAEVVLNHNERTIGFEFASLDYTAPESIQYRYRLRGLEADWNPAGTLSRAVYSNLPRGQSMVFEVQATNSDGIWSGRQLALGIVTRPSPWLSGWAFLLYAVTAIGLALVCGLLVARRARLKSERKAARKVKMYLDCLEQASESVAIVGDRGELVFSNRAAAPHFLDPNGPVARLFNESEARSQALAAVAAQGRWQTTLEDHRNDQPRWYDVSLSGVDMEGQDTAVVAIISDVTRKKLAERELQHHREKLEKLVLDRTAELQETIGQQRLAEDNLRLSLREKEVLIKEVHHRVKNNMQVITSLLRLQSGDTDDAEITRMLAESENRIHSMALIHESLYQSDNLLDIDFQDYLTRLTGILNRMYRKPDSSLEIRIDAQRVYLDIESAVPCGLIVNELVSNAMKHAFRGVEHEAVVTITAKTVDDNHCEIRVADNGRGFPADVDFRNSPSLGMEIVCILTEQLGGTIEMERSNGTVFCLQFPVSLRPGSTVPPLAVAN